MQMVTCQIVAYLWTLAGQLDISTCYEQTSHNTSRMQEFLQKIKRLLSQELGIDKKHKAVQVIMESLFTDDAVNELKKYGPVLAKMTTSEKHQKSLLGGVERLAGQTYPTLVPNGVPKLLIGLYQIDALEEETVKAWSTHVSKKYVDKETSKRVRKAAAPFVTWLEEAESSEEEEEDDKPATKAAPTKATIPNHHKAPAKKQEDEDEDSDLDNL